MKYIYNNSYFIEKVLQMNEESIVEILDSKGDHYYQKVIEKKNGFRRLDCINEGLLKVLQRNLKSNFLDSMPIPDYIYGFIKNSSYKDFLVPHINQKYYLRVDVKNFFSSIDKDLIYEAFNDCFKIESSLEKTETFNLFNEIVTLNGVLPQGAVTSPVVSNVVFRRIDIRIKYYCDKLGVKYSRYADDLLFSSDNEFIHKKFFMKKLSQILKSKNFSLNYNKTLKFENEISLNGFIVGSGLRLSRKRKSDLAKVIKTCNKFSQFKNIQPLLDALNQLNLNYKKRNYIYQNQEVYFISRKSLINYLLGFRSFYIDWLRTQEMNDERDLDYLIKRIEKIVYKLS